MLPFCTVLAYEQSCAAPKLLRTRYKMLVKVRKWSCTLEECQLADRLGPVKKAQSSKLRSGRNGKGLRPIHEVALGATAGQVRTTGIAGHNGLRVKGYR